LTQAGRAARVLYLPLLHLFFGYNQWAALEQNGPPPSAANERLILFLGRLELYKGVAHLLAAFAQLPPPARAESCLILAGRGTLPSVWRDALPAGVELRNRLIEDAEGLELIQRCRVLVLPYLGATQSALPAAAYFFNKPVIVTRSGALPEYVEHGRTGLIVPPGDTPALADGLAYALNHPAEMAAMGRAGRAWYEAQRRQETAALHALYGMQKA
jgi:glycosyltransferase involved in cell wall biosynthesis